MEERKRYVTTFLPDGRRAYNPSRTERDINDEKEAFRQQLIDAGETDRFVLAMQPSEMWRQQQEEGERWSEWQQRVWFPRMAALQAERPDTELTAEEWEYLAELLAGANHPLGASIAAKAIARQAGKTPPAS